MKKITIKQASDRAGVSEQAMRVMIQHGVIAGAKCYGPKCRRTYYITDTQLTNFMKGVKQ
jgi:hypothetical protein